MRLLLWKLTSLAAIATACPSFLPHGLEYKTSDRNHNETIARRWTEVVTHPRNFVQPWPRWLDGRTRIRYCFTNPETFDLLDQLVSSAVTLWFNHLGPPGATSGHSLSILEHPLSYCFLPGNTANPSARFTWNPQVQDDTVHIMIDYNMVASAGASAGYSDGAIQRHIELPLKGRHVIHVSPRLITEFQGGNMRTIATLAHEFGHVIGLEHEHQRADRDQYVYFDCTGLIGYAEKAAEVQAVGKHTMEQVCSDPFIAREYGWDFLISAFAKKEGVWDMRGHEYEMHRTHGVEYDYSSIMHYSSEHMTNYWPLWPYADWSTAQTPLRRWKNGDRYFTPPERATDQNSELILSNLWPSRLDVEAVKRLYPW